MKIQFDYYYGAEAEQFAFYRIPRLIIKDKRFKCLSNDAKLLYGLLLDRMSLSVKNGWLDSENRVYIIYTIDAIMEDLGCGRDKAIKTLQELDSKKGIGLIEKKRRGMGKPDIIYVKNFIEVDIPDEENDDCDETVRTEEASVENTEVGKTDFKKSEMSTSRVMKCRLQEVGKADSIYTDINNTDISYTNHINQSQDILGQTNNNTIDRIDTKAYIDIVKRNVEYEHHMAYDDICDRELYDEMFRVICDVVCFKRNTIRVAGILYPYEVVRARFLELNSSHLEYVMTCMQNTTNKINNIKSYITTALFNAPSTINYYYQQEVLSDMNGG